MRHTKKNGIEALNRLGLSFLVISSDKNIGQYNDYALGELNKRVIHSVDLTRAKFVILTSSSETKYPTGKVFQGMISDAREDYFVIDGFKRFDYRDIVFLTDRYGQYYTEAKNRFKIAGQLMDLDFEEEFKNDEVTKIEKYKPKPMAETKPGKGDFKWHPWPGKSSEKEEAIGEVAEKFIFNTPNDTSSDIHFTTDRGVEVSGSTHPVSPEDAFDALEDVISNNAELNYLEQQVARMDESNRKLYDNAVKNYIQSQYTRTYYGGIDPLSEDSSPDSEG